MQAPVCPTLAKSHCRGREAEAEAEETQTALMMWDLRRRNDGRSEESFLLAVVFVFAFVSLRGLLTYPRYPPRPSFLP
jgi:hypothetical protein